MLDQAFGHRGACITAVRGTFPPLELYLLPSDRPKLQGIERCWKVRRRRATHNRLFPTLAQLQQAVRNNLCYYQTRKHRVLSVLQSLRNRSKSSAA